LNYRRAVPVRSDFPAYHNFPEVYHGEGITTPPFSGADRAVTVQGSNTTYKEIVAERVAHIVFTCRSAPGRFGKIRNHQKSDLRNVKVKLLP
ncbi:MAG: hypothetical protein E6724_24570, partial [Escherichia coli]|nr:hypothetical protein [Escherichia coli]